MFSCEFCKFFKKETLSQVFSCEFCKKHLWETFKEFWQQGRQGLDNLKTDDDIINVRSRDFNKLRLFRSILTTPKVKITWNWKMLYNALSTKASSPRMDIMISKRHQLSSDHCQGQKQPSRGVFIKRFSENMQPSYRRTSMPKCDFNKIALQLYWNHTSAWVFSWKFAAYFQNNFS